MSPDTLHYLLQGINNVTWQSLTMIAIGLLLIWLAIKKEYEPLLLLPIGSGAILANLPLVRDALEAGTLVQPFAAPVIQRYAFWAVAPSARLEDAAVRAVWDWLCACRENTARVHRSAQ